MDYNYSYFEGVFKKINYNSKNTIEEFIQIKSNKNPIEGNYYYCMNYLNNQLTDNHKHFYGVFDYNNDKLFAVISKVRIGPAQYNRLIDFPISQNQNLENEVKFLELLFTSEYIDQSFVSNFNINRLNINEYKNYGIVDYNFYCDVKRDVNKKFVTGARLSLIEKALGFEFRKVIVTDKEKLFELFNSWANVHKSLHSLTLFSNYFYNFNTLVTYNQLIQYVLTYGETPIALVVFIPTIEGYCYQPIQFTYDRNVFQGNQTVDKVLSQIGGILQTLFLKELDKLGYKYISLAGAAGFNKKLLENKQHLADCIEYYKVTKR